MPELKFIGSARCGGVRCSDPFASLSVSAQQITLKIPFATYTFSSGNVVCLRIGSQGMISIEHSISSYPSRVLFLSLEINAQDLITQIEQIGFIPCGNEKHKVSYRGSPLRLWSILAFVLLWNLPYWATPRYPILSLLVPLPIISTAIISIFTIALMKFDILQRFIIKPQRSIREIMPFLSLVAFLSGVLTIAMLVMLVTRQYSSVEKENSLCRVELLAKQAWWYTPRIR
ncbi:MAG: hypothetical protein MUF49_01385 [Oculatellaceae cyanobacterium Prado106]|jgi:hypothetical protein|nr:hypothetical protein [Oculatellaceae cyanobacterium Prado106]